MFNLPYTTFWFLFLYKQHLQNILTQKSLNALQKELTDCLNSEH